MWVSAVSRRISSTLLHSIHPRWPRTNSPDLWRSCERSHHVREILFTRSSHDNKSIPRADPEVATEPGFKSWAWRHFLQHKWHHWIDDNSDRESGGHTGDGRGWPGRTIIFVVTRPGEISLYQIFPGDDSHRIMLWGTGRSRGVRCLWEICSRCFEPRVKVTFVALKIRNNLHYFVIGANLRPFLRSLK